GDTSILVGGYWSGATASSPLGPWSDVFFAAQFGSYRSQVAAISMSSAGTAVAVGYYNYLGVRRGGQSFTPLMPPSSAEWLNDVTWQAGGRWWVVGEKGAILASTDDATSFQAQASATTSDLYAVAFANSQTGLAVGAHGTALYTSDGGATWK